MLDHDQWETADKIIGDLIVNGLNPRVMSLRCKSIIAGRGDGRSGVGDVQRIFIQLVCAIYRSLKRIFKVLLNWKQQQHFIPAGIVYILVLFTKVTGSQK